MRRGLETEGNFSQEEPRKASWRRWHLNRASQEKRGSGDSEKEARMFPEKGTARTAAWGAGVSAAALGGRDRDAEAVVLSRRERGGGLVCGAQVWLQAPLGPRLGHGSPRWPHRCHPHLPEGGDGREKRPFTSTPSGPQVLAAGLAGLQPSPWGALRHPLSPCPPPAAPLGPRCLPGPCPDTRGTASPRGARDHQGPGAQGTWAGPAVRPSVCPAAARPFCQQGREGSLECPARGDTAWSSPGPRPC